MTQAIATIASIITTRLAPYIAINVAVATRQLIVAKIEQLTQSIKIDEICGDAID